MIINEVDVSSKINLFVDKTKSLVIITQLKKFLDIIYHWLKETKLNLGPSK